MNELSVRKLLPDLAALLTALRDQGCQAELPFLITLVAGTDVARLALKIDTQVALIHLVSTRMTAIRALEIAACDEVERVEFDGQAVALQTLLLKP